MTEAFPERIKIVLLEVSFPIEEASRLQRVMFKALSPETAKIALLEPGNF